MIITKHLTRRMSQRGITSEMVSLVLQYGRIEDDKFILDKKSTDELLDELDRIRRRLLKIRDKGGVVVVTEDESLITTYNKDSYNRGK